MTVIRIRTIVAVSTLSLALLVSAWLPLAARQAAPAPAGGVTNTVDPALVAGLKWRSVGPFVGGRVTAVAGHRSQLNTFYMGATGGGVWKTTDAGATWANISDGYFETASIGAIEVAESDPNVDLRRHRQPRDPQQRHRRARHVQVDRRREDVDTRRVCARPDRSVRCASIPTIQVSSTWPRSERLRPQRDRGIYRSPTAARAGEGALRLRPHRRRRPRDRTRRTRRDLRYDVARRAEAMDDHLRRPREGGIYKRPTAATSGEARDGLPRNLIGKTDIDIDARSPNRVYALVEAPSPEAGLYRSDDSGASWKMVRIRVTRAAAGPPVLLHQRRRRSEERRHRLGEHPAS